MEADMTDRELLEMAAKAACIAPSDGGPVVVYESSGVWLADDKWWNPLTDDGDRYRLAKTLDVRIHFGPAYVTYTAGGICGVVRWPEDEPDDAHAIVRAAAEIGKSA
jgi:hypothetical protein